MDADLQKRLDVLEDKVNAIYRSTEKTRKYFLWTLIITVAAIVLPLIGLVFVIPSFLAAFQIPVGL